MKWICSFAVLLVLFCVEVTARAGSVTLTYIYTDPQGTPLAEADVNGNITATFDYMPYGVQALGSPVNGIGYTGHVADSDSGLIYMQARYYDPTIGRFTSVDPTPVRPGDGYNFNRFAYAENNPAKNVDPDGRDSVGEIIDQKAMDAASQGSSIRTYGWAFAGTAWSFLGAEGVSQVSDKGTDAGAGNSIMAVVEIVTLGKGGTAIKAGEKIAEGAARLSIKGFTGHAVDQAINRGVKTSHILDAIKNPLKIGEVKIDALGRESQKIVGSKATLAINPQTGKVVTVYPTSTKTAEKLIREVAQ